jgi:hypothetical protein
MAHGFSMKWRTAGDDILRELCKDDFERWLWKKEIVEVSQYADLRSETAFPAFDGLPEENDVSLEVLRERRWVFIPSAQTLVLPCRDY